MRLVSVIPSTSKHKKYTAIFDNGKKIHFGAKGYGDYIVYTQTKGKVIANAKRRAYIARHSKGGENWGNPQTAGALSRWILWEEPTLEQAVNRYRTRFSR